MFASAEVLPSLRLRPRPDVNPTPSPIRISDTLSLMGATIRYARGSEVYGEDEPADFLYRVTSGAVRVVKLLSDGRRQVSAFHFAGDVFGVEAAENHQFAAEAIANCEILVIKRKAAFDLAERDPEVARALWLATLKDLARAQDHMLVLGRKTAFEKVATFLLDMARRAGNGSALELPMSRYDIADYLGLTIETVSRTISEMEHSGIVSLRSARRLDICRQSALESLHA